MSKKNARKQRSRPDSSRVRRLLEKGDAKEAVKEARRCFRADTSQANRSLLEAAYLGRAEQLHRLKQNAEAKSVLAELMLLKPTAPDITGRLARLQVLLGDRNPAADTVFKDDPALLTEMVDQAVLDERNVVPDCGHTTVQVTAIREALVGVERGEDDAAAELLTNIPRTSPLADWRLFVRGLSAFYAKDEARTAKNWGRLDKARPAFRIAETLLAAIDPQAERKSTTGLTDRLRRLERHTQTDRTDSLVKELATAWRQGKWPTFTARLKSLARMSDAAAGTLVRQVVDIAWKRAVRELRPQLLRQLANSGVAPEFDPNWNRAHALMADHPRSDVDIETMEQHWLDYADDIKNADFLPEQERPIAVGLVYQRIARDMSHNAQRLQDAGEPRFYSFDDDEQDIERERKWFHNRAERYYCDSFDACPALTDSYLELSALHQENDNLKKAATVLQKLAKADPDSFEAVSWLAGYYLAEDQPDKALKYIAAVKRLRPRDPQCAILEWNQKITKVRVSAVKRKFDDAHQALDEAAAAAPESLDPFTIDMLRAGIHLKAKNADEGHALVDKVLTQVAAPTPIWMIMAGVCRRMRVPRELAKVFDERFKTAIAEPLTSEAAGRMAAYLWAQRDAKASYTGLATQERLLIKALRKRDTVDWQDQDLRHVCRFITSIARLRWERRLYYETGRELFPKTPHYWYWLALAEVENLPFFVSPKEALTLLETAIRLHEAGPVRLPESDLEKARQALSLVKERCEQLGGMPSFGFQYDDDDDDYDDDDDDEMDEDERLDRDVNQFEYDDSELGGLFAGDNPDRARSLEYVVNSLNESIPDSVRRELEAVRGETGLDTQEVLRIIAATVVDGEPLEVALARLMPDDRDQKGMLP